MLLDTSGLLCAFGWDEPGLRMACELLGRSGAKLTHSYVLSELVILERVRG